MPHRLPPDKRALPTRSAHGFRWNAKHLVCRVACSACRSFPLVVLRALEEASETSEIGFRLRRVSLGLDLQQQNKNGRWQASASKCRRQISNHSSILANPISLTLVTRCSQSNLPKVNK